MDLNENEMSVLDRVWGTINDTNRSVGFDEIADSIPISDEDVKFICYELEEKGWLRIDGSDIYYDRSCRRKYTELKCGPIPKNNHVGCKNCCSKKYRVVNSYNQLEFRECSCCGRRYRVEIIGSIERLL